MSRTELYHRLRAFPTNVQWSWCAMHEHQEFAVFTIWEDRIIDGRNCLTPEDLKKRKGNGYKDQMRVIEQAMALGIPAYGMVAVAKDPEANPRRIKSFDDQYLIQLELSQEGGLYYARHLDKVHVLDVINRRKDSALSDLTASPPEGVTAPDRALSVGFSFKRDPKVRAYVIKRAKGCCEYCGKQGFEMANGQHYIEAHHIIALSQQGDDTPQNVIALCPEHHREAHFGVDTEPLEHAFISKLNVIEQVATN
ncbi:MAG: HNH endonuclease [Opitutaceae bacterium]